MKIKLDELIYQISFALDCVERDLLNVSTNHSKRVAYLCILLGRESGFSEAGLLDLACAAVLHDNALTEYILSERDYNGNEETRVMNISKHCELGETNARAFPFLGSVEGYILYHHENANGTGAFKKYAFEIPAGAKLIRIADNVDAQFRLGEYEKGRLETIHRHVKENKGTLYDGETAELFLRCVTDEILKKLDNGVIDESLRNITPKLEKECALEELVAFSEVIARIVDYKSPFTEKHSYEIAQKARVMAGYYGYDEETTLCLYLAAALHDLGKLATPQSILEKPGPLTDEEFEVMKMHAYYTYKMLSNIRNLGIIVTWAASHHEKLDGTGYPFGKKAEELDFNCRLLACIDIYQALSEDRPYRKGMAHGRAMEILWQMAEQGKIDETIVADMNTVFSDEQKVLLR